MCATLYHTPLVGAYDKNLDKSTMSILFNKTCIEEGRDWYTYMNKDKKNPPLPTYFIL